MPGLLIRDSRIITPALRDGAPTTGPITALVMSGAGGYFTEAIDVGTFSEIIAFLLVANISGSPTLDVNLQYSSDKVNWVDSGDAFAQVVSTPGLTFKKITANFGKYIRFRLLLGGTTPVYTVTLQLAVKA